MDTGLAAGTRLHWEACLNLRETGGYPAGTGQRIRPARLLRGDDLSRLTTAGSAALLAYGVRTVIDLRSPDQLTARPHPFHPDYAGATPVRYHFLPFIDPADVQGHQALDASMSLVQIYQVLLTRYATQVGRIFRTMLDAPAGAVLVHCSAGKDRTGLVIALALGLAGVAPETIIADYALSDQYLQDYYAQRMASVGDNPVLQARLRRRLSALPETMQQTLEFIDTRYGGVASYLGHAGLSDTQLSELTERLCEASAA